MHDKSAPDQRAPGEEEQESNPDAVDFYWRPGCMFCTSLRRSLNKRGIPIREHNIWDNPDTAEFVASLAGGNETVPTVVVGDRFAVNPTPQEVERLVAECAPELLPAIEASDPRAGNWFTRLFSSSGS